jgi:hypothetical protein
MNGLQPKTFARFGSGYTTGSRTNKVRRDMRYLEIKTGPWREEPLPWWCRVLQKIIPAANPDLERLYSRTRKWWLELDDSGKPLREIGFDTDMKPFVIGPVGRNFGFLVDSSDDWSTSREDSPEAAAGFEKAWQELWPSFEHLNREGSEPDGAGNSHSAGH